MNQTKQICNHYEMCGGCNKQDINYKEQLQQKEEMVKDLFTKAEIDVEEFLNIKPSPNIFEYRNNMEFSFGDLEKDGELQLGMHPRGMRYDVVTVDACQLVDNDFRIIIKTIIDYFRNQPFRKYHIKLEEGFLRNLIVRKGLHTGEILINLVTTTQQQHDFTDLTEELKNLDYQGELVGFLQTLNDNHADVVQCDELITHYGRDYFFEELLGIKFKVKPFSFFQPNTTGAEVLYETIKDYLGDADNKIIYDLYCGTGTIAQSVVSEAKKVIGIELMEEAVEMARENAKLNNLDNCQFIAGDVLEKVDKLDQTPDVIIVDPPRPGIHPDALQKIIAFDAKEIIYVSCNPKTLVRDLKEITTKGYTAKKVQPVDMFPHTNHVETSVHLVKE
ncbi:23S rRNA (uracil(1939)-C(5))-methyltransferase RlmD [Selenihalanaerobacter shriftii]|uniref:23S rRNA m(5)U-1939 methyltransferase n=1 Tax=Selenihalanaerobacter shriftii TaxID=142842 RepID=A0A1T4PKM0_9FIRM|nr:23S rRNA (uracil(1939)-C(5))-methyltransferase RlmD [Selenihalanaerobacter shriftii]SJZ91901.1 23S rRNA m(5)U-1939 methyltransferase [Selenihalanaerobacter shriftii]